MTKEIIHDLILKPNTQENEQSNTVLKCYCQMEGFSEKYFSFLRRLKDEIAKQQSKITRNNM